MISQKKRDEKNINEKKERRKVHKRRNIRKDGDWNGIDRLSWLKSRDSALKISNEICHKD
jgi:hypothetical protein